MTFANFDVDVMKSQERDIERSLEEVSNLINDNNRWTVIGWHKRGVTNGTGDTRSDTVGAQTRGHLIRLFPTNPPTTENFVNTFQAAQYYYSAP